jgi:hypothetical protein
MASRLHIVGVACAIALGLLSAQAAQASFHLIQIREVYPGSLANPQSEYVELQMWRSDENFVSGHFLRSYDAGGAVVATSTFPRDVPKGANQSTLVMATPQAEAEFGVRADAALAPAGQLSPSGGAVCWEALDCVSWGSFAGALPSSAGAAVAPAGIPDGMALRRSIRRGCPTALDPKDDRNDSASDFATVSPAPRPNAVAPTERLCNGAPQTTLRKKPPKRTADRTPTFRFRADEARAKFQCKLDRRRFRLCRSPLTANRLSFGQHTFRVRAIDREGNVDPTPATYRFRVSRPG